MCILASIILSTFSVNEEDYKKELNIIAPSINRFLDNVNTYELKYKTFITPMQELAIKGLRRTGAGFTDLSGWLFKNNLLYGSKEGNNAAANFQKYYNYMLYKSTISLGEEKGSCEFFDKNKIRNSKFVQNMIKEFPDLKFETMRNITVSSIAPVGTLSMMTRNSVMSYGVEPGFGLYYWKRTRISGEYKYYFIVPSVVRKLFSANNINLPITSDTIEDTWDGEKGLKISKIIDNNKNKLDILFKEATEVNPLNKMDLMGELMNSVDSSISVTYLLSTKTSIEEVEKFILKGYDLGVKSIATFPDTKMYGIISKIPFKELANNLTQEGVNIHPQNFSEKERKELMVFDKGIIYTSAPKRPKKLKADIYQIRIKNTKYIIAVGLLNGVPYEIFGGEAKNFSFTFREKSGVLTKVKRNHYELTIHISENKEIKINNISKQFTNYEQDEFRLISMSLRHGTPIKFIVEQLSKSTEDMFSTAASVSRVLKKYILDGEIASGKVCPNCGNNKLSYLEGCVSCSCGWSKCD